MPWWRIGFGMIGIFLYTGARIATSAGEADPELGGFNPINAILHLVILLGSAALVARNWRACLPLLRPAVATVAVFTMIPIWNDLWFPLIVAPGEATKTVTLGAQVFIGQFVTNWNAVLAALTLAVLPVLCLYLLFSRQLIRGITAGAVK